MQLECTLPGVEYPSEVMAHLARDFFDGYLGHQVEIDLGTDLGQARRQNLGALVRGVVGEIVRQRCVGEVCEAAEITQRRVGKASPDHAGLDVRVESHRYGRLDTAADDDELVDEGISGRRQVCTSSRSCSSCAGDMVSTTSTSKYGRLRMIMRMPVMIRSSVSSRCSP